METFIFLELTDLCPHLNQVLQIHWEILFQKIRYMASEEDKHCPVASTNMCTHVHSYLHIVAHTHKNNYTYHIHVTYTCILANGKASWITSFPRRRPQRWDYTRCRHSLTISLWNNKWSRVMNNRKFLLGQPRGYRSGHSELFPQWSINASQFDHPRMLLIVSVNPMTMHMIPWVSNL